MRQDNWTLISASVKTSARCEALLSFLMQAILPYRDVSIYLIALQDYIARCNLPLRSTSLSSAGRSRYMGRVVYELFVPLLL